ncbi:hypothetical protein ElyMa_002998600, partial [Elysia marginata]
MATPINDWSKLEVKAVVRFLFPKVVVEEEEEEEEEEAVVVVEEEVVIVVVAVVIVVVTLIVVLVEVACRVDFDISTAGGGDTIGYRSTIVIVFIHKLAPEVPIFSPQLLVLEVGLY